MLWGEPRNNMTFDLIADSRPEMDVYHLDAKFKNGFFSSYRLRGIGIRQPEWVDIK
jgi:hypothetical protein